MNPLEAPRRISFDLETFAGVARKKWWIVPLTMLIGLTLMFWQESDLKTEARYFSLTRMYEPTDEGAPLTLVGVNTDLIGQFPDETNQALLLESAEITQKIQANFDREISLSVQPFDKTFSLNTETDGPAVTRFSFKPSRRFSYELTCIESDEKNCAEALNLYAQELQTIRLTATKAGFANSIELIDSLLAADIQLSPDDLSRLNLQKNAFNQAITLASGEIIQISERKYLEGETVQTVDIKSYLFGLLVGLVIGIIILIQFVVTDSKIRSARSLITATSYEKYLGEATSTTDSNSLQLLAAALRGSSPDEIRWIKILPVGAETIDERFATVLAKILGEQVSITKSFVQLTAADLAPSKGAAFLLAVVKNSAQVGELKQIWSVIEKSGNTVLGSALITQ